MTFTPVHGPGEIIRLPTIDPNDQNVPQWVRDRYAGRRVVIWTEDHLGIEGNIVAGGPEPAGHPGQEQR
jgi:hypothetical protein